MLADGALLGRVSFKSCNWGILYVKKNFDICPFILIKLRWRCVAVQIKILVTNFMTDSLARLVPPSAFPPVPTFVYYQFLLLIYYISSLIKLPRCFCRSVVHGAIIQFNFAWIALTFIYDTSRQQHWLSSLTVGIYIHERNGPSDLAPAPGSITVLLSAFATRMHPTSISNSFSRILGWDISKLEAHAIEYTKESCKSSRKSSWSAR